MYQAFVFVVLLGVPAVFANEFTRVVNGSDAQEGEFPFVVSLRYQNGHRCGGTILNANKILTAAHCMCNGSEAAWYANLHTIQYGLLRIQADETNAIQVNETDCHNYNESSMYIYDIAILTLNDSIPADKLHRVIIEDRNVSDQNRDAVVVGWGRNFTNGFLPEILQVGEVMLYNDTICEGAFGGRVFLEHHICAGWPENGRGSCQGDSGGPLLVNNYQVGVVSFGAAGNCGISNASLPKVLARVGSYVDFIKSKAGDVLLASEVENDGDDDGDDGDGDDGEDGSSSAITACLFLIVSSLYLPSFF